MDGRKAMSGYCHKMGNWETPSGSSAVVHWRCHRHGVIPECELVPFYPRYTTPPWASALSKYPQYFCPKCIEEFLGKPLAAAVDVIEGKLGDDAICVEVGCRVTHGLKPCATCGQPVCGLHIVEGECSGCCEVRDYSGYCG